MNSFSQTGQRSPHHLPYASVWCGFPAIFSGEPMGRQLQRLDKMIQNYVRHYRERPGAIVAGGEELLELMKEVGGQPIVLFETLLYLVDQDILGVIADPKDLHRSRFTQKENP